MPPVSHPEEKPNPGTDTDSGIGTDLVQMARETAYDRYIQALLIKPKHLRRDFLVLAALHGELARIPLLVREPMMGEMRLQWWHDVMAATEFMNKDASPDFGSPLANHVAGLIGGFPAARENVLRAIDARRAELDVAAFANLSDFEAYLDGAGTALLRVGLDVLGGGDADAAVTPALSAAGRAIGCADLALRLPRLAAFGRLPQFPDERVKAKTPSEPMTEAALAQQISTAMETLERQALAALHVYRNLQPGLQSGLSTQISQTVLPLALVEPYFKALQGVAERPLQAENPKSPLARFFRLWWAARRQRI